MPARTPYAQGRQSAGLASGLGLRGLDRRRRGSQGQGDDRPSRRAGQWLSGSAARANFAGEARGWRRYSEHPRQKGVGRDRCCLPCILHRDPLRSCVDEGEPRVRGRDFGLRVASVRRLPRWSRAILAFGGTPLLRSHIPPSSRTSSSPPRPAPRLWVLPFSLGAGRTG